MQREYENTFMDLKRDLDNIANKMTKYREKLLLIEGSDDKEAKPIAAMLLRTSPANVGSIGMHAQLLGHTYTSATYRHPHLKV